MRHFFSCGNQPLGKRKVEAQSEDGMVAPGAPMPSGQHQDTKLYVSERPVSGRRNQDLLGPKGSAVSASNWMMPNSYFVSAKSMALTGDIQQDEANGPHLNGHIQCVCKPTENGYVEEEPKTEMEAFIIRDHDLDVFPDSVAEVNSIVEGPPENDAVLQPADKADGIKTHYFCSQKRKVQWVDDFGKELVQVLEYEASDTGESEEDDDDDDAHACTCTIQ